MLETFKINQQNRSEAFDERIKFLIFHYTAVDLSTSIKLLQDKVSCHYLISDHPVEIFNLVDEEKRAWHAGESFWGGRVNLNDSSIGIEIVNLDGNSNQYLEAQIDALMFLSKQIIAKYNIAPDCVLGHSDIAPLRKKDPGILFPWVKLYEEKIGAMPNQLDVADLEKNIDLPTASDLQQNLAKYGYKIDLTGQFDFQTKEVLNAFRRHFCPQFLNQEIDKTSYATLLALIKKYRIKQSGIGKFPKN